MSFPPPEPDPEDGAAQVHGDVRDTIEMVKYYMFVRKDHPRQGKHNALQKGAYFAMPWVAVLIVISGIAIWKPVTLAPLTNLLGGYQFARYEHFLGMSLLVVLTVGHVFMVFAVDPYSIRSMTTGGYSERFSPEERNARPFINLWPKRAPLPIPEVATVVAGPVDEPMAAIVAPPVDEPTPPTEQL